MPDLVIGTIAQNVQISGASVDEIKSMLVELGLQVTGTDTVPAAPAAPAEESPAPKKKRASRKKAPAKKEPEPEVEEAAEPEDDEPPATPKRSSKARSRKATEDLDETAEPAPKKKRTSRKKAPAKKAPEPEPEPEEAEGDDEGMTDDEIVDALQDSKFRRLKDVVAFLVEEARWEYEGAEEDIAAFCAERQEDIPCIAGAKNIRTRAQTQAELML